MWHDNETSVDLLGFDYLSDALVEVVTDERLLPVTVGVFGDWGSGKSSLMRVTRDKLNGRGDIIAIDFSAWQFESYEDVKAALMQVILRRLREEEGLSEKAAGLREKLVKRVDWFYALGLAASRVATLTPPTLEELRKVVRPEEEQDESQAIQEFRADFEALLAEIERISALVVFIDDLDRCLPNNIIETFEAVRLFLFVPKTAFVIAADERIIRYAIQTRYPQEAGVDLGRDYLEKIVQVPVRIPPLTAAEVESYLNLLFAELDLNADQLAALQAKASEARASDSLAVTCNYGIAASVVDPVPKQLQANFELVSRITPILANGLNGNPRQVKRFMNAVVLRQRAAAARGITLDAAVLVKLMILEYLHEVQFRGLFESQAVNHGRPPELAEAEKAAANGDEAEAPEAAAYLNDEALRRWLELEPPFADIDLQPYFYFSRDRIDVATPGRRLSRDLQELLGQLASESDAFQTEGLKKAAELPDTESRALFDALTERFARAPSSALGKVLVEMAAGRKELRPALLAMLATVPPVSIHPAVPLLLAAKFDEGEVAELLTLWAKDGVSPLAKASKTALERLGRKGGK